jgi:hypothetical protein
VKKIPKKKNLCLNKKINPNWVNTKPRDGNKKQEKLLHEEELSPNIVFKAYLAKIKHKNML